jgi:hypothetical protein
LCADFQTAAIHFVSLAACMMISYLVLGTQGDLIGGWSLNKEQLFIGFTRLLYPFSLAFCYAVWVNSFA